MPFGIGPWELLIILVIALLLFGAKRLPEIAKGLGKGIKEFKGAMKETTEQLKSGMEDTDTKPPTPPGSDSNQKSNDKQD
ncbi:MAG TPA: twin-arginine translocase TatA/TatE family subunit [candidate division Zixibacteria bacterium]|nr:twin-arginine translocase TatA/TatE family subunit [candidate division Zixibacteria bacterium]